MPGILDDSNVISRIDSQGMLGAIADMPEFMLHQLQARHSTIVKAGSRIPRNIVLIGMGGSASAADVTLDWLSPKMLVPAVVHRDPVIPKFVGSDTLLVAMSYSGDTVETLAAFREARKRGATLVGIGTGGKLRKFSDDWHVPFLSVGSAIAPRAALGQMTVACAQALYGYGMISNPNAEIMSVIHELKRLNSRIRTKTRYAENPAKHLASLVKDRVPAIFALGRLAAVARRFKNQLAENSKLTAKYSLLPEAAHNEIEGWQDQRLPLIPVFIRDYSESDLEELMFRSFRSMITKASGVRTEQVQLNSGTRLGALLSPILYLDYVSVYLALLRGVDPTDAPLIRQYRARF